MTVYQLDIPLPPPHNMQLEKQSTSDYVIMGAILLVMTIGLSAGLHKIGFVERVCGRCCPSLCCCCCCCHVKRGLTRIAGGGSWRNVAHHDNDEHTDDDEDDDEDGLELSGRYDEMDRASHGFRASIDTSVRNQKILRSSSPNQAMSIGTGADEDKKSPSNGNSGSGKSKSHILHEAIVKAATGISGSKKEQETKYTQLRIDDEDDMI
jgi:hypothetical protein